MAGQPGAVRFTDDECAFILGAVQYSDKLQRPRKLMYEELGVKFDRPWQSIAKVVQRLSPTVNLAQARLRAAAAKMAKHVIQKGSVSEHIDVLSRPNMGVLEPIKKNDGGGGGGFFSSITVESCGTSRTTISQGKPALPDGGADGTVIDVGAPAIEPAVVGDAGAALPPSEYLVLSNLNEPEHPKPKGFVERKLELSRARLEAARSLVGSEERAMDRPKGASRKGPRTARERKITKEIVESRGKV